jgi:hypothetical protein
VCALVCCQCAWLLCGVPTRTAHHSTTQHSTAQHNTTRARDCTGHTSRAHLRQVCDLHVPLGLDDLAAVGLQAPHHDLQLRGLASAVHAWGACVCARARVCVCVAWGGGAGQPEARAWRAMRAAAAATAGGGGGGGRGAGTAPCTPRSVLVHPQQHPTTPQTPTHNHTHPTTRPPTHTHTRPHTPASAPPRLTHEPHALALLHLPAHIAQHLLVLERHRDLWCVRTHVCVCLRVC